MQGGRQERQHRHLSLGRTGQPHSAGRHNQADQRVRTADDWAAHFADRIVPDAQNSTILTSRNVTRGGVY